LLHAESEEAVTKTFDAVPQLKSEFSPIAGLILKVLREKKFPKTRKAQINFLADSLAGRDWISPRRSRDICEAERKKSFIYIIRQDFYIECPCGYARTRLPQSLSEMWGREPGFDRVSFLFLIFFRQ
jgi:hypothetical protein